jgi:hypothetical protein
MTKTEMQAEALANARAGQSVMNYAAIFEGFMAKGTRSILTTDLVHRRRFLRTQRRFTPLDVDARLRESRWVSSRASASHPAHHNALSPAEGSSA